MKSLLLLKITENMSIYYKIYKHYLL